MDINSKKKKFEQCFAEFKYFEKFIIRFSLGFRFAIKTISFEQFCTLPCFTEKKKPAAVHFLLLNRLVINPLLRVIYSVCSESLPAPIYFSNSL